MFLRKGQVTALLEHVQELREEITTQSLRTEDQDWICLSDPGNASKDANWTDYLSNHQLCYEAFMTNPLCRRYIKFITYFCVGKGLEVVAEEPDVQEVIDAFWKREDNRMKSRAKQLSDELGAYGELFIRFFYDDLLGLTRIGFIDPSEITYVETDPDNIGRDVRYYRRYRVAGTPHVGADGSVTVKFDTEAEVIDAVREDGLLNVYHARVNNVSNAVRGVPDLLPVVKWAVRYSEWLQDRYILNRIRNLFHYDVTIDKGNKKQVAAYLSSLKNKKVGSATEETDDSIAEASSSYRIKTGSIRVHTDKIKWEVVQPKIAADDAKEDGRAIKLMFCAGSGIPEHWLGNAGEANLASAKAMDLPTLQQFEDRQEYLGEVFEAILAQAILCSRLYGDLPAPSEGGKDEYNTNVQLSFPPLEPKQLTEAAGAFKTMVEALTAAVTTGRISEDTANKILQQYDENIQDWDGDGGEREKIENERAESVKRQLGMAPDGAI
jgi:hypothetical protein